MNEPTKPYQHLIAALWGDMRLREFELSPIQTTELGLICDRLIDTASAYGFADASRARDIICRRFGIGTSHETLLSIAQSYGITTERVRQIEAKFLRRMKYPSRIFDLKNFLADAGLCEKPAELVVDFADTFRERVRAGEVLSDEELSTIKMDELELSVRSANSLKNEGIVTLADLKARTRQSLRRTPNFGKKSLDEVDEMIAGFGVTLTDK